jgi:hypothetical protein
MLITVKVAAIITHLQCIFCMKHGLIRKKFSDKITNNVLLALTPIANFTISEG